MSRGQVTLFIILGIVLILVFVLSIVFTSVIHQEALNEEARQAVQNAVSLYPPQRYIDYCVEYHLDVLIKEQSISGATFFPGDYESVIDRSNQVKLWYVQGIGNQLMTPQHIADELKEVLEPILRRCVDVRVYEQQGFDVTAGVLSITRVSITDQTIIIEVDFPLILQKDNSISDTSHYTTQHISPIGKLISMGNAIVNTHIDRKDPDILAIMKQMDGLVRVTRSRPYPYAIYTIEHINSEIILNVAIEQQDVFSLIDDTPPGCCEIQGVCYAGVDADLCRSRQGFYSAICACDTKKVAQRFSDDDHQCLFGECRDCQGALHGESWCIENKGVGGRFFREFCYDGEIMQDPCMDFRQEICVEKQDPLSYSKCRVNAYHECPLCTDQQCCQDIYRRDCRWISDQVGCRPAVSPGIPFWQTDFAGAFCSQGSIQCDDCDLSAQEVFDSCRSVGDCGAQVNVYGEFSLGGLSSAVASGVNTVQFLPDRDLAYTINAPSSSIQLQDNQGSISRMIASTIQLLDTLSQIPIQRYLDPTTNIPIASDSVHYCYGWESPESAVCSYCMEGNQPCSEYLCRSLGRRCMFTMIDGYGFCFPRQVTPSAPIQLLGVLAPGYSVEQISPGGYKISQPVTDNIFSLDMVVSSPARCKVTYLPGRNFDNIGGQDMSGFIFSHQQNLQMRLTSDLQVIGQFLDVFNVQTYRELADELVILRAKLEALAQRYPQVARFSSGYYPIIVPFVDAYLDPATREDMINVLDAVEEGLYHMFISCMDESGSQNTAGFIQFNLAHRCDDITPPQILEATYTPGSGIVLYTDEFSACKFDRIDRPYLAMQHSMECPRSRADIDPARDLYRCTAQEQQWFSDIEHVYIRCIDNPESIAKMPIDALISFIPDTDATHTSSIQLLNQEHYQIPIGQYNVTVELEVGMGYSCEANGEVLACSDQSCLLVADQPQQVTIRCRSDQAICPHFPNKMDSGYRLEILPSNIQIQRTQIIGTAIEVELVGDAVSCSVQHPVFTIDLDQDNRVWRGSIITAPQGRYRVDIICTHQDGGIAQETVTIVR